MNLFKRDERRKKTEECKEHGDENCTNVETRNKGSFIEELYHLERNILLELHSR